MATCEATSDEYLLGKAAGPEQLGGSGGAQQGEAWSALPNNTWSEVVHAVFPNEGWKRFTREGDRGAAFTKFWLTNSNPAVSSSLPVDDIFEVLDLTPQILLDL